MKKKYLEIGKITKLQGLKGDVRVQYYCDSPEMLCEFGTLYAGREHTPFEPERARYLKADVAVLKLKGVDTPEDAEKLIGKMLYFDRSAAELPEGTWFIQDIVGLSVYDADSGKCYGVIDDVYQNGAAAVYSIKTPSGKQLMFPAIPEVLLDTDIDGGRLTIRPLDGLFEPEAAEDDEN